MTPILGSELLQGETVYLNRVTREDVPAITRMWTDVEFLRYIARRMTYPEVIEDFEEWYEAMRDEHAPPTFAIRRRSDQQFLGLIGLRDIRWSSRHSVFWVGIGDAAERGKGYGTDAVLVLLKYAFMEVNLNCLGLEVFSYNSPAIRSYEKIGFQHDGVVRAYVYRDGHYYDMHLMSMTRAEWDARYGASVKVKRK